MNDTENPQLDMSMEIARLEAELAAMRTVASKAMHNYETALMKLIKVEAELAKLQAAHEQCLIERNRLGVEAAGLRSIVERLKAENQWHPASEPPDSARLVLDTNSEKIYFNKSRVGLCRGCSVDTGWLNLQGDVATPTSWRELPKPPKDVRQ